MLPAVNIKPARRNTRPRPISSTDSAASTGLASNPNGTYIANPFPTTAQNGMQGQFGAMLPSTSIPNSPLYNMLTTGGGATQPTRPNTPLYNMLTTGGGALQQPTPPLQLGTISGSAQKKPGSQVLRKSQASPNEPSVPLASGEHQKPALIG